MEDVAINDWPTDWPGQAFDLNGSNPWLPAYGFQTPSALLERDDFIGNPAEKFADEVKLSEFVVWKESLYMKIDGLSLRV
ncbi:hypothetical protein HHI36_012259 [Cryptolaemus montrouzieri]|uniref:Uncharacterized protein n=1 Tax=Cryptolaemus montrouzieri TaxID=559131 RepID=A0ABD2NDR4_9CUCU